MQPLRTQACCHKRPHNTLPHHQQRLLCCHISFNRVGPAMGCVEREEGERREERGGGALMALTSTGVLCRAESPHSSAIHTVGGLSMASQKGYKRAKHRAEGMCFGVRGQKALSKLFSFCIDNPLSAHLGDFFLISHAKASGTTQKVEILQQLRKDYELCQTCTARRRDSAARRRLAKRCISLLPRRASGQAWYHGRVHRPSSTMHSGC